MGIQATATFNYPHRNDIGPCFQPGDTVTGRLDLTVKHSVKPKDVSIFFCGLSKTTYYVSNGQYTQTYVEEDPLVETQVEHNHDKGYLPPKLEPGLIYQWPFSFKLPMETKHVRPQTIVSRQPQTPDPDFEEGPHPLPPSATGVTYSVQLWYKGLAPWTHKIVLPLVVSQAPVEPSAQLTERQGERMDFARKGRMGFNIQRRDGGKSARPPPPPLMLPLPIIVCYARLPNDVSEPISLAVSANHGQMTKRFTVVSLDLQVMYCSKDRTFCTYGRRNQFSYHDNFNSKHDTYTRHVNLKLPANGTPVTVISEPSFKQLAPESVGAYSFRTYNRSRHYTMSIIIRVRDESGRQSAFIVMVPWEVVPVTKNGNSRSSGSSTRRLHEVSSAEIGGIRTSVFKATNNDVDSDNDSIVSRHVYEVLEDDTIVEVKKPRHLPRSDKMSSATTTDGASDDAESSLEMTEEERRGLVMIKHAWWKDETCEDWKHCN